jgi:hypothetical protein
MSVKRGGQIITSNSEREVWCVAAGIQA